MGAGSLDAEEIKRHPWFDEINWEDVYNRKLVPPKPNIKALATQTEEPAPFEQRPAGGVDRIDGWSFAATAGKR